jgi:hypothetical protein
MQAHSVDDLARSFERHPRAQNKSPRIVECYLDVGTWALSGRPSSSRSARRSREGSPGQLPSLRQSNSPKLISGCWRGLA